MKHIFTIGLSLLIVAVGCQKVDLIQTDQPSPSLSLPEGITIERVIRDPKQIVLGEQLENPFSIENMQSALELLRDSVEMPQNSMGLTRSQIDGVEIAPTDLYVRMCAVDSASNELLLAEKTLSLYDYPRDYEIREQGDYYSDTVGVVDTRYKWWYAVVPTSYKPRTDVKFEVLEEIFIPEHSEYFSKEVIDSTTTTRGITTKVMDQNFVMNLKIAAFYLTGNYEEIRQAVEQSEEAKTRATYTDCVNYSFLFIRWTSCRTYYRPSGFIKLKTTKSEVALKNVKVRFARWFEEDVVYTNEDGYYIGDKEWDDIWLFNNLEYQVIFQGDNGINRWTQNHFIGQAKYNAGVHHPNGHSITFYENSHYWGRGVLHNAISDFGVVCSKPQRMKTMTSHMNIQAVEKYDDMIIGAAFMGFPSTMWLEFIRRYYAHDQITYLAWHELAHAGHYQTLVDLRGQDFATNFWNTLYFKEIGGYGEKGDPNWENIALAEGWATYCEWYFAKKHLGTFPSLEDSECTDYPFYYMFMFKRLHEETGVSLSQLQRSLAVNTLREFRQRVMTFTRPQNKYKVLNIVGEYL